MLRVAEHLARTPTSAASARATRTTSSSTSPLFVVADGMGGAQAGEVASEMAVEAFHDGLPDGRRAEALVRLIAGPTTASTTARAPTPSTPAWARR